MNYQEFSEKTKQEPTPDQDLPPALQALWWDAGGNWQKAHDICQTGQGRAVAWVHGYLHRKEGDLSNAGYWYGRAGKARYDGTVDEEWERIVKSLIRDLDEE